MSYFPRYRDYTPLWTDTSKPTSRRYVFIAIALLAGSAILNVVLYNKLSHRWQVPLDNYQQL